MRAIGPTPAVVSRAMSDAEEEFEGGVPPLVEPLGAVPRIVARRVRHVHADSDDRHRATMTVIAEVFLALADEQLLLRRNRRAPHRRVQLLEAGRELGEDRIDEFPQGAERMVGGNAIFDRSRAEENRLPLVGSTHALAHESEGAQTYRAPLEELVTNSLVFQQPARVSFSLSA